VTTCEYAGFPCCMRTFMTEGWIRSIFTAMSLLFRRYPDGAPGMGQCEGSGTGLGVGPPVKRLVVFERLPGACPFPYQQDEGIRRGDLLGKLVGPRGARRHAGGRKERARLRSLRSIAFLELGAQGRWEG